MCHARWFLIAVLAGSASFLGCGGDKHPSPVAPQVIAPVADPPHESDPKGEAPVKPASRESPGETGPNSGEKRNPESMP